PVASPGAAALDGKNHQPSGLWRRAGDQSSLRRLCAHRDGGAPAARPARQGNPARMRRGGRRRGRPAAAGRRQGSVAFNDPVSARREDMTDSSEAFLVPWRTYDEIPVGFTFAGTGRTITDADLLMSALGGSFAPLHADA